MQRTGQVLTLSAGQLNLLFVLMPAAILLIVATVLRLFPALWTRTVQGSEDTRNRSMDGARGLLTLWVLTHHLNVLALGPHGDLRAGSGAVSLLMGSSFFTAPFYMLTAMLFGGALLASKGAFDTPRFLRRRFFRLAPAYLVSIALVVLAAFAMTGFELRVDPLKLLKQVARWCSFGFLPRYDINGADVSDWHGMLWTLRYEIGFYLLLPLLAWAQRRTGSPAVVVLALAGVGLFAWPFIFFTAGVLAAAALRWRGGRAPLLWSLAAVAAIVLLGATAAWTGPVLQAALLIPVFAAVALEAPLFRLLRTRPVRFVGEISYSVYVLHFPLLCAVFHFFIAPHAITAMPFLARIGALAVVGGLVLGASALCYLFVERPSIRLSKLQDRVNISARVELA